MVDPSADLEAIRMAMAAAGRRRLAIVDRDGLFAGLLCLKRTGEGFCPDADVQASADERHQCAAAVMSGHA